ncbi:MAG: hypothetical protein FWC67_01850, partial [Defluviitaleaceae bacterium]|nr:hypothetical protein [Defluviitaleaceae bacterium]
MKSKQSKFNIAVAIIFSVIASAFSVVVAFLFREMGTAAEYGDLDGFVIAVIWQASLFPVSFAFDLAAVRFRLAYTFEM